jgi:hypothetical protein
MSASLLKSDLSTALRRWVVAFFLLFFPTYVAGEQALAGEVNFKILGHRLEDEGLRVDFRLLNDSKNDVCLFAPPTISTVARLFDNRSGYFVRDWLDDDDTSGAGSYGGMSIAERGKAVLRPGKYLEFDWLILPIGDPTLVDSANVPVEGLVHKRSLSLVSSITLTDCDFDQPDVAVRLGRFQVLKARDYRLKGNLETLFPEE